MPDPLEWQDDALCAQVATEMFFPEKGGRSDYAKQICAQCPVAEQCLQLALSMPENPPGIWGGTSVFERRPLRREVA